jgi:hypothetical protein
MSVWVLVIMPKDKKNSETFDNNLHLNNKTNTMKKLLFLLLFLSFVACKKDRNCSNGQLCIKNSTGATVHYGWNTNIYTDSIAPGAIVCHDVGKIENTLTSQTSQTTYFNSDHGSYNIEVTTCHQEHELQ